MALDAVAEILIAEYDLAAEHALIVVTHQATLRARAAEVLRGRGQTHLLSLARALRAQCVAVVAVESLPAAVRGVAEADGEGAP